MPQQEARASASESFPVTGTKQDCDETVHCEIAHGDQVQGIGQETSQHQGREHTLGGIDGERRTASSTEVAVSLMSQAWRAIINAVPRRLGTPTEREG